ncbi:MAG: hypothetical protein U1F37_16850 [Alphaproteobacteria bacterium]
MLASGLVGYSAARISLRWSRIFANASLLTDFLRETPVNPVLDAPCRNQVLSASSAVLLSRQFAKAFTLILGLCCIMIVLGVPSLRPMLHDPMILALCGIASFTAVNVLYILAGTLIFYLIYCRRVTLITATIFLLGLMLSFDIVEGSRS